MAMGHGPWGMGEEGKGPMPGSPVGVSGFASRVCLEFQLGEKTSIFRVPKANLPGPPRLVVSSHVSRPIWSPSPSPSRGRSRAQSPRVESNMWRVTAIHDSILGEEELLLVPGTEELKN